MDAAWFEDLRGQLLALLIAVEDRLGPEQAAWVHHVIDVDEYGLALEDMVGILTQASAPVTDQERAGMLALARTMQMDDWYRAIFNAAARPGRPAPPVRAALPGGLRVLRGGAASDQHGAQEIAALCRRHGLGCQMAGSRRSAACARN